MESNKKQKLKSKIEVQSNKKINIFFYLCILILVVLTYFVFQKAKDNQFVNWDDQVYLEEQPLVLNKEYNKLWKTPISLNYHPITMISLAIQVPKDVKKLSPKPFITINIWLHIFNTILVFLLIWMIHQKKWFIALMTAAIFALHPMHVESVVWISERKDVLYTFFFLLSCISYWQYLNKNKKYWLLFCFIFFLCSVLSKAMAVMLPLVLILLDYWKGRPLKNIKLILEKTPFLALSLFFGLMAVSVQSGGDFGGLLILYGEKSKAVAEEGIFTYWQRFQFASYGFMNYIFKFFYPGELSAFHPYPVNNELPSLAGFLYPLGMIITIAFGIWSGFKTKIFAFGIGFYFITVALVLQFMAVGLAIIADRYTYLPYIGLAFMMIYAVEHWVATRSDNLKYLSIFIGTFYIIFLGIKTTKQVKAWENSETLWTQALISYPNEDLCLANRGNYRGKTGNIVGAMEDFEKAVADGCTRADVFEGLGNSYGTMSDQQPDKKQELVNKAIEMYRKAIELDPSKGNIHYNLGIAQLVTNPTASAAAFEQALKLMPYKEGEILPILGMAYLNSGKYIETVTILSQALQNYQKTDAMYYHRGLANLGLGNNVAAKADFSEAVKLNPENQEAKLRLQSL